MEDFVKEVDARYELVTDPKSTMKLSKHAKVEDEWQGITLRKLPE